MTQEDHVDTPSTRTGLARIDIQSVIWWPSDHPDAWHVGVSAGRDGETYPLAEIEERWGPTRLVTIADVSTQDAAGPDHSQQLADRDRATRAAIFAVDNVLIGSGIDRLPSAYHSRAAVEAALGYLIGHGLITVTPEADWPEWLPVQCPDHLVPDLAGMVGQWMTVPKP
jgi:hypothetical protein